MRYCLWVELYPGYILESVIGVGGELSTIEELQLSDLLSVRDGIRRCILALGDAGSGSNLTSAPMDSRAP